MRAKHDASMSSMTEIDARVRCVPRSRSQSSSRAPWILKRAKTRTGRVPLAGKARLPWTRVFEFLAGHGSLPSRPGELTDGRRSHRGSGSTGAVGCVRNMAAHSADPEWKLWLAYWASRLRPGRKPAAKSEARVDPVDHTGTPLSRPFLAEHPDGRVAVGPGNGSVRDATPNGSIRRLVVSAQPKAVRQSKAKSRSGSNGRPDPQWPAADATNGYIRPSSQEACPRCEDSASRGATYCHACGRRLASDATSVPPAPGPVLAEGAEQPPKRKAVGSRTRRSPRLGRSSLP